MVKLSCATFLLLGFAVSAQAGVVLSFTGNWASSADDADLAANNDPYVPLVVAVDIGLDGTPSIGSISTATAAGDSFATGFSVTGTATGGFGSTIILSLAGEADTSDVDTTPASRSILGRNAGGIGMRNGNSGRIDNGNSTFNERINVEFDATDVLLAGFDVRLDTIGIAGANSIGAFIPDLGINDFDGSDILFVDVTTAGTSDPTPTFYAIANGARLAGGSVGQIAIGQPDRAEGGNSGFRLNAIGFDVITIPEPSSLLLLTLAIATLGLRRKSA